jgi:signal transduction histidine kinase
VDSLLYLPYAAVLVSMGMLAGKGLPVPCTPLLGLTGVLLVHQFMLQREVRASRDTLEQKVLERTRQLQEAQTLAMRSERANTMALLGAGMAHDLNNALMVVSGSIEAIKLRAERGGAPDEGALERIQAAAERCAGLSKCLMGLGRAQEDPPRFYELNQMILKSEELLRMIVPKRIRLELRVCEEPLRA